MKKTMAVAIIAILCAGMFASCLSLLEERDGYGHTQEEREAYEAEWAEATRAEFEGSLEREFGVEVELEVAEGQDIYEAYEAERIRLSEAAEAERTRQRETEEAERTQQRQQAEDHFRQGVQYFTQANALAKSKDYQQAVEVYQKAMVEYDAANENEGGSNRGYRGYESSQEGVTSRYAYDERAAIERKLEEINKICGVRISLYSQLAGNVLVNGEYIVDENNAQIVIEADKTRELTVMVWQENSEFQFAVESAGDKKQYPAFQPSITLARNDSRAVFVGDPNLTAQEADFTVEQLPDNTIRITDYTGRAKIISIPEKLYGLPVTVIGEGAFSGQGLVSVIIPDTVTEIMPSAFSGNKTLVDVSLGKGIRTIGGYAFSDCGLTTISLPAGITAIERHVFSSNQLVEINLPNRLQRIGEDAFSGNKLSKINLPNSLQKIDRWTFNRNKLSEINLPNGLQTVDYEAFGNNPITTVVIPPSLAPARAISGSFSGCPITRVTLPANMDESNMALFETSLVNFWKSQNKVAGTYVKNGPVWTRQ